MPGFWGAITAFTPVTLFHEQNPLDVCSGEGISATQTP